ncbi:helix-turn-helix domain-containing protein [Sphingobium sp. TCM1]|uniref:helix-turn-helix domain-containing protein n=1 Tax=Sphingobium sp. TCM1 TaxID=453246 RepID=UPI0007F4464F|nr:helix-turn-helix domain-containing protein [Sphingobium sp. TCM1]OAN54309.1 hypothetical protein A7Q26_24035 [Sphingobium sp. TCM1]
MGTLAFGDAMATALRASASGRRTDAGHAQGHDWPRSRSAPPHRTGAPVLRGSIEEGTFEHRFFAVPAQGETDRLLRLARRALDVGRQLRRAARRDGVELSPAQKLLTTLTAASVRVLEELLMLARLNAGRVFPSYDHLAEVTGLGRATVARALALLEKVGFLVRQRRFKRVEGEGAGPRYAQTSNVYRAILPQAVLACLPRWMRPAPPPDDVVVREAERREAMAAMRASLEPADRRAAADKGLLAKLLARIEATLDAQDCESQKHPQPLIQSYNKGKSGVRLTAKTSNTYRK